MKRFELIAIVSFLAFAHPAGARPAPWYKWQGADGDTVCAQTSPGPGWVRLEVTYVDPRCMRRDIRAAGNAKAKSRK
ncbi:MAG: hypothetical protein LBS49_01095 [Candidatus Accumulibacter sp.]|jgi:hypothetical protein|nr:hypothetical protein [Accumulibacter sp.]